MQSAEDYLQSIAHVTILVASGSARDLLPARAESERLQRVVVARDLEGCRELEPALAAHGIQAIEVGRYLEESQPKALIADTWHSDFEKARLRGSKLFSRPELISLAGVSGQSGPADAGRTFIIANSPSRELAALLRSAGGVLVLAPHFHRTPQMLPMRKPGHEPCVVILGSPDSQAVKYALALAEAWRASVRLVRPPAAAEHAAHSGPASISAQEFLAGIAAGTEIQPLFALDLSRGELGLQLCREMLDRLQVPVATMTEQLSLRRRPPMTIATEADLYDVFRCFMLEPDVASKAAFEYPRGHAYDKAAGWGSIAARFGNTIGVAGAA